MNKRNLPMEFSQSFIQRMIHASREYARYSGDPATISESFGSFSNGRDALYNALLYEAHVAMKDPSAAYEDEPLLCCVDLHTTNPGLVVKHDDEGTRVVHLDGTESEHSQLDKLALYASPVPYERHLEGLLKSQLHPMLEQTILVGNSVHACTVPKLKDLCRRAKLKVSGVKQELIDRLQQNGGMPNVQLIHGPPGTGKTYTMLTMLKQMQDYPHTHRFLVCAPSNVAVINLYTRAREWGLKGTLVMRDEKIPIEVDISDEEREQWNPKQARIVFATVSARCGSKLRKEHFQTVIMDEAAQCMEAWAWGIFRESLTQLILAGDPHQLPALTSQEGTQCGHGRSLMERLMSIGHPSKLLNIQRRMHPDIVHFPNLEFYQGQLGSEFDVSSDRCSSTPYCALAVESSETKVGTSYRNDAEAKVVVSMAKKLRAKYSDIVVISPYKAQCEYLRTLEPQLVVHTVDSFQGKEADVILLTTVRSGASVGFWRDRRRLNVALTRAKHVLRVIGSVKTWARGDTVMSKLAHDVQCRQLVQQLGVRELMALGVRVPLQQAVDFSATQPWGRPVVSQRAIMAAKNDPNAEAALCRALVKLCSGSTSVRANGSVHTLDELGYTIDWNVDIDSGTKRTMIQIHNVRLKGTDSQLYTEMCKVIEKRGPDWNGACVYGPQPTTLCEIPYKGIRWVPPAPAPVRDRQRERMQAQQFVTKLRR